MCNCNHNYYFVCAILLKCKRVQTIRIVYPVKGFFSAISKQKTRLKWSYKILVQLMLNAEANAIHHLLSPQWQRTFSLFLSLDFWYFSFSDPADRLLNCHLSNLCVCLKILNTSMFSDFLQFALMYITLLIYRHVCDNSRCALVCTENSNCSANQYCGLERQVCMSVLGTSCDAHRECDVNYQCHPRLYCHPVTQTCRYFAKEGIRCNSQACGQSCTTLLHRGLFEKYFC